MPQSRQFDEREIVARFRGNIRDLLSRYQPDPHSTDITDISLNEILAVMGKEKHREYATAFDNELKEYSRRVQAIHWELGGILFWWDYGKLWAADGFDYTSFSNWGESNADWLPYASSQLTKFKHAYATYIYRLNIPERHPDLMQPLLNSGNIDKPHRIATYMVEENIYDWIPALQKMSRDEVNERAKRMKALAAKGIEPRDMLPQMTGGEIIGRQIEYREQVRLGSLTLNDFYGEFDPDDIVDATFETEYDTRRINIHRLR